MPYDTLDDAYYLNRYSYSREFLLLVPRTYRLCMEIVYIRSPED